eukprot:gene18754-biopygen2446
MGRCEDWLLSHALRDGEASRPPIPPPAVGLYAQKKHLSRARVPHHIKRPPLPGLGGRSSSLRGSGPPAAPGTRGGAGQSAVLRQRGAGGGRADGWHGARICASGCAQMVPPAPRWCRAGRWMVGWVARCGGRGVGNFRDFPGRVPARKSAPRAARPPQPAARPGRAEGVD